MINLDPKEIYDKLEVTGHEWARLNAVARQMEEAQKSELHSIVQEEIASGSTSIAAAESKARADSRTMAYIRNMVSARQAADEARVTYDAAKVWFEAMRTVASTMRQEMKMVGGHQ